jgi:2,3-bisphosphoglycerate-independent phosphoglycerate mutase
MDRDRRWEKIQHAYQMMTGAENKTNLKPEAYILSEYKTGIFDEFITPTLFNEDAAIKNGDSMFFFNFRPDRARQISLAFNDKHFNEFPVTVKPNYYLCMSPYIPDECPELPILFDKEKVKGTLSEFLASRGKKQFKIAETEKYAHVTYFFNGGEETPFEGEQRSLGASPRELKTYEEKPEMSHYEVTDKLLAALENKSFSFYLVNFANADMVGHTGNFEAAKQAIEVVDECVGRLVLRLLELNAHVFITADLLGTGHPLARPPQDAAAVVWT